MFGDPGREHCGGDALAVSIIHTHTHHSHTQPHNASALTYARFLDLRCATLVSPACAACSRSAFVSISMPPTVGPALMWMEPGVSSNSPALPPRPGVAVSIWGGAKGGAQQQAHVRE